MSDDNWRRASQLDGEQFAALLQIKSRPYTLRELADRTGVSAATLSRLERGYMPDLETFFTLCSWMDVSPAMFMVNAPVSDCASCERLRQSLRDIGEIIRREGLS